VVARRGRIACQWIHYWGDGSVVGGEVRGWLGCDLTPPGNALCLWPPQSSLSMAIIHSGIGRQVAQLPCLSEVEHCIHRRERCQWGSHTELELSRPVWPLARAWLLGSAHPRTLQALARPRPCNTTCTCNPPTALLCTAVPTPFPVCHPLFSAAMQDIARNAWFPRPYSDSHRLFLFHMLADLRSWLFNANARFHSGPDLVPSPVRLKLLTQVARAVSSFGLSCPLPPTHVRIRRIRHQVY
jgi:hypothetical protein